MANRVPNRRDLARYSVNREGWEVISQSLYDFQTYAAAGQTQLTFFAVPTGQGGKTLSDTNMNLAGQLPANQEFLVSSLEVIFFPTVPAVAAQNPAAFGAQAVANIINDVYVVSRTGNLKFDIGSKPYLQEAPLGRFPPMTYMHLEAAAADVSTAGANFQTRIAYAHSAGRPYYLQPEKLRLISTQNFQITLNWPEGVQALPSGNPGRIGVVLDGVLFRKSQ
jgi:hypothetical protein